MIRNKAILLKSRGIAFSKIAVPRTIKTAVFILVIGLILNFWGAVQVGATEPIVTSTGQTLYVPVYSHVYYGDKEHRINLTITLSVRNTDMEKTLTLTSVEYFDSEGKPVREYLEAPVKIAPLAATRFLVDESDLVGGSGACFIVKWESGAAMNAPVVQGVMIGAAANQGISFQTEGRPMP